MAAPITIDLEYTRGDTEPFGFTLRDSAGAALDVSGSTFVLAVNTEDDGNSATSAELFNLAATFVTDGTDGQILFTPTAVNSDQEADTYFYEVQQSTPTIRTIIKGSFAFLPQIITP